jgi:hypothetical protein
MNANIVAIRKQVYDMKFQKNVPEANSQSTRASSQ